jgi:hypothetical protein
MGWQVECVFNPNTGVEELVVSASHRDITQSSGIQFGEGVN